jgi:hypothetical protein
MFEESAFIAFTTLDLVHAKGFWVTQLGFPIVRAAELFHGGCLWVRLCFDLPDGDDHRSPSSDGVIGLKVKDLGAALTALRSRGIEAVAGKFDDQQGVARIRVGAPIISDKY